MAQPVQLPQHQSRMQLRNTALCMCKLSRKGSANLQPGRLCKVLEGSKLRRDIPGIFEMQPCYRAPLERTEWSCMPPVSGSLGLTGLYTDTQCPWEQAGDTLTLQTGREQTAPECCRARHRGIRNVSGAESNLLYQRAGIMFTDLCSHSTSFLFQGKQRAMH